MLQLLNKIFPLLDTLYFLQLTNYDTKIFLTKAHYFYTRRNLQVRDHLVFTNKVKLIVLLYILGLILIGAMFRFWVIIPIILTPYLIALINFVVQFVTQIREDFKLKNLNLKDKKDLEIILITGSQGKTTLKYMLYNAVKAFRRTQIIPDNINTTSGVVNWLDKNLLGNTQLLIFETEPFYAGEMTKIINAMKPRFRILTNLTDQHLMRFGSLEKLHAAYLEIAKDSEGCVLLSGEGLWKKNSPLEGEGTARFPCDILSEGWQAKPDGVDQSDAANNGDTVVAATNQSNLSHSGTGSFAQLKMTTPFGVPRLKEEIINFIQSKNQPEYMASYFAICERVLEELGVEQRFQSFSKDWITGLPQRRKNIVTLWGHEVIDDSYNISLESAKSSIEYALEYAGKEDKKLIIITAGIPESSNNPIDANVAFGEYLRPMIDDGIINVILLQSEFYPHIKKQITNYQSAQNLNGIPAILRHYNALECTVLFLPELNDFYY
jgi:UDP-N-acetylmuramyl pentapeptide synthase